MVEPFPPPPLYPTVECFSPHVCRGNWKERKNRVFRNEQRNEKVEAGLIVKLLVENMQNRKWRKLSSLATLSEQRIARNWKLMEGFAKVDNSKHLVKARTKWCHPERIGLN